MNSIGNYSDIKNLIEKYRHPPPEKNESKKNDLKMRVMKILFGNFDQYEEWLCCNYKRRWMEQKVGEFMQEIFGTLKGHEDLKIGHPSKVDIKTDNDIFLELKVDAQTMNSDSKHSVNLKLEELQKKGYKAFCVQMFRKEKNEPKNNHMSGNKYLNEYVSKDIGGMEGLINYIEKVDTSLDIIFSQLHL